MVDIRLNGNQQVSYPYGILAGQYADFVFTTPGTLSYYLGVGSYNELQNPDVWFQLTGSDIITAGETTTVTFSNPTIGQLLSNFNLSGRDFTGEYYCYSCNILYGMAKFHFGYNGQWTLYDNNVYKSGGNVTLVEWLDYSFDVKFRLSPTEPIITIAYPFDMFFYDNGPPDFPRIFYTAQ
jgi:hypothetical protein